MDLLKIKITRTALFVCLACNCIAVSSTYAQNSPWDYDPNTSKESSKESESSSEKGSSSKSDGSEEAESQTAESLGYLKEILNYGVKGNWTGSVEGMSYRLYGPEAGNDIRYYQGVTPEETWGKRTIKLKVDVRSGTAAGMIYGFQENPTRYYMIIVSGDNELKVMERTPDGFAERMAISLEANEEPVALEVREKGNYIDLFVNGNNVIGFGNDSVGKGGAGIIAVNSGDYVFSDFELTVDESSEDETGNDQVSGNKEMPGKGAGADRVGAGGAGGDSVEEAEPQTAKSLGPLKEIVSYGDAENWAGTIEGNNYRMHGPEAKGDIRYYFLETPEETWGQRTIKVNVDVRAGGAAGMLYGFQEDPKRYYMITVSGENELKIVQRTPDGFEERTVASFEHGGGPVALEIRENGNNIEVLVNGNDMVGLGNDSMGKGAVGIIAVDAGDYVFSDFELTDN